MRIGTQELIIILIIVLLIFGPSQIPKLSRMIGKAVKGAKKEVDKANDRINETGETHEDQEDA